MDDVQKLIQNGLTIFKKDDTTQKYFQANIQWLEEQLKYIKNNIIRIGLIGVTSSGKSTILNALLGENLLPTAVRPSSGILITVSRASKKKVTIYFEDAPPKVLTGTNIKVDVARYGDEKFNPKNSLGVKHIDVESPNFLLDEKLQIVDSPGLDAYGLEYHETLTMETLLPSVNLCLYAVTMKANADESTYQALHTIEKHGKPMIIIQNMLDSVEPKKGKTGVILKTKQQVAQEHENRIRQIVDKVTNNKQSDLNQLVDIVQISAKEALTAREMKNKRLFSSSNMNQLIEAINENIKRLEKYMKYERKEQIIHHMQEIIEDEQERMKELTAHHEKIKQRMGRIESIQKDYSDSFSTIDNRIEKKLLSIETTVKEKIKDLEQLDERAIDEAKNINNTLRKQVSTLEKYIIDQTNQLNQKTKEIISELKWNEHDLQQDLLIKKVMDNKDFQVKTKIETKSRKVKKKGVIGLGKRAFGKLFRQDDWGYTEEYYDVQVIDTKVMISQVKKDFSEITKELKNFTGQWKKRSQAFGKNLAKELNRITTENKQKNTFTVDMDKLSALITNLEQIVIQSGNQSPKKEAKLKKSVSKNNRQENVERKSKEVDPTVFALYQLSNRFTSRYFQKIWDYTQKQSYQQKAFQATLIWGWDEASLLHFASRFLVATLGESERSNLQKKGFIQLSTDKEKVILVLENRNLRVQDVMKKIGKQHMNTYVLLNTIQMGAARKQLEGSKLFQIPSIQDGCMNWVSQSILEFKGDNMGEGLQSLYSIIDGVNNQYGNSILLNDKNPLYSMVMLELRNYQQITLVDEQRLIKQIKIKYPYFITKNEIDDIVQLVRAYKTNNEGVSMT